MLDQTDSAAERPATRHLLLGLGVLLLLAAPAAAQDRLLKIKVEKVDVGFRALADEAAGGLFKTGLWAPVFISLRADDHGAIDLPARADGTSHGVIRIEGVDADGGPTVYPAPFVIGPKEPVTVVGYTMPGSTTTDLNLTLVPEEQPERRIKLAAETATALALQQHLYLALGSGLPDLHTTLVDLAGNREDGATAPRFAATESAAARLPDLWFGYEGVDLLVLTTDNSRFLEGLEGRPAKMKALAEWVRRGGRLLVSVSWRNQERVSKLLAGPAWQPALPAVVPPTGTTKLTSLVGAQNWARILNKPFPVSAREPLRVPRLRPEAGADVLFKEETGEPLLLRLPYGRGSVTFLAFDLDRGAFAGWPGRVDFWKALLNALAPKVQGAANAETAGPDFGATDIAGRLQRELDNFDVPVISFGWVALFILLYIVVVGPLDYLILKKVFKRLEWTWITFPAVVVLVSVIAYFTAYALKGHDLKVNQIDLVDIDQRSDLDAGGRTRTAHAYGTSWFTVLSPRTQSYTIAVGPALKAWPVGAAKSGEPMVTWFGRPEAGTGGYGRQRAQTLFRRAFAYAPGATGLRDVPIPIWTTKAFTAAWDVSLAGPPLVADLHYQPGDAEQRLGGTITSALGAGLEDVYLFYGTKAYPLEGLRTAGKGAGAVPVVLDPARAIDADRWARSGGRAWLKDEPAAPGQPFAPSPVVKQLLFHEFAGGNNHSLRMLDESWRLRELQGRDQGVRDAILVARLPRAQGPGRALTHLSLGARVDNLAQDTYIRVFLPVRPQ